MDQDKFIEGMCKDINLTEKDVEYIMALSLAACNKSTKCMVIMEELAELQQAVSKMVREEKCSIYHLIEEMADVTICLDFLQRIFGISDETLAQAVKIKLLREGERRGFDGGAR